jgi:hypothetical protein
LFFTSSLVNNVFVDTQESLLTSTVHKYPAPSHSIVASTTAAVGVLVFTHPHRYNFNSTLAGQKYPEAFEVQLLYVFGPEHT